MGNEYYIGVDVGTGSARACVIDAAGEIKGLASEDIQLWRVAHGLEEIHYEQSTTDIWNHICGSVRQAMAQAGIEASAVRGIGFDATCSLAVFSHDTDEPMTVTKTFLHAKTAEEGKDPNARNIILWLDHRALEETNTINATGHNLLRYVGGTMNVEMEMPKVLWLKNHMTAEAFGRCKFYDLADALTHLATGSETRSFCSAVCKQGYVPVGVDGSVKGWQEDFYRAVGLGELADDNFKRVGGVNGVNGHFLSAGELVGPLSSKAAAQLGLPAGIAVGSGVIDAYAGWIGTVGAQVDLGGGGAGSGEHTVAQAFTRLASVAGTSTCHLAMSRDAVFVDGVWGPYRDVVLPDFWMAEGGQSATGELIRHVVETHAAYAAAKETAAAAQTNIYDHLNGRLRALASEAGAPAVGYLARHLFFYGDLWGNRSPLADPHMRGALVGVSHGDSGADGLALQYYAALEFIALQTRQIVEAMNAAGHTIRSVFMSGSQCRNELLVGLIATACGLPVVIPRYDSAAVVHGAAMLGAKAASAGDAAAGGQTEALWTIMTRMTRAGRVVPPSADAGEAKLLGAKYEVMLDQLRTQREYRQKVNTAIQGWKKE